MLVDHIQNRKRYEGCHKNIAAALEFMARKAGETAPETGTYEVIHGEVIVHVMDKTSHPRGEAKMEIHKNFMDIHFVLEGGERVAIAPLQDAPYDEKTDNAFYDCDDDYLVLLREGEFCAVWPFEPHCPLCDPGKTSRPVRKMVAKVKVD